MLMEKYGVLMQKDQAPDRTSSVLEKVARYRDNEEVS
jgi:hypothetical protein